MISIFYYKEKKFLGNIFKNCFLLCSGDGGDDEREDEEEDAGSPLRQSRSGTRLRNMYQKLKDERFKCNVCGKIAKEQTNIRKHLRKHTGE
jgi:hypothetical protein